MNERDRIIQGALIAVLLIFAFWSGGNYQMAELYRDYRGIYENAMGDL